MILPSCKRERWMFWFTQGIAMQPISPVPPCHCLEFAGLALQSTLRTAAENSLSRIAHGILPCANYQRN